jgi:hypothetical protein
VIIALICAHRSHHESDWSNGVAGIVEEHLILGVDERDLQIEKSRWLTENPGIEVVETIIQQEPPTLLARIGGKYVPRLSMLVRYHAVMHSEAPLSPSSPSGENAGNDRADDKGNQSAHQDLLTGESSVDVENMAQQGRGQNRGH